MTSEASAPPLDLPRQVIRRGILVALAVVLAAVALGLWRMQDDIDEEVAAATTLAGLTAQLGGLGGLDERSALASLAAMQRERPLRHVQLRVHAAGGRLLLGPPPEAEPAAPLAALLALHRRWLPAPERHVIAWPVARPDGPPWRVSLTVSPESERREAMQSLLGVLALLLACTGGLLLAMHWNLKRAFAPLGRLLAAMRGIESGDTRAVRALAPMPIRELESVAAALRHLAHALDDAEAQRRQLSRQVMTLQEDERARIARDLHDEFGQRLTAMRVDAAYLLRRLQGDAALQGVADGIAAQCAHIQQDIRSLLARLQPFGPEADAEGETAERLAASLQQLAGVWGAGSAACTLRLDWRPDESTPPGPWPEVGGAALRLPRALALVLYRLSQEALTNAARHAGARQVVLALRCTGAWQPGAPCTFDWSVQDDGVGIADVALAARRGNGIAGMRERVWAQGGDLRFVAAEPGLRLEATLAARWLGVDVTGSSAVRA